MIKTLRRLVFSALNSSIVEHIVKNRNLDKLFVLCCSIHLLVPVFLYCVVFFNLYSGLCMVWHA